MAAKADMKKPPRLAAWLVAHLATRYARDSLLGDLLEEYGQGRSSLWYWKQVAIATGLKVCNALRITGQRSVARSLLGGMAAAFWITAIIALLRQSNGASTCSSHSSQILLACLGAVCFTTSMLWRREEGIRRRGLRRGLLLVSVTVALSTATLTWAGTTTRALGAPCRAIR